MPLSGYNRSVCALTYSAVGAHVFVHVLILDEAEQKSFPWARWAAAASKLRHIKEKQVPPNSRANRLSV